MRIGNDYKLGVWYDSCPFLFSYGLKEKQRLCQFLTNQHTYKQRNSLLKHTKGEIKKLWVFKNFKYKWLIPLSLYKPVTLKAPKCFKIHPPKVKSKITIADMKHNIYFKSTKQEHNRERRKELILQRRRAKQLSKLESGQFEYLTFQSSTIRSLKTENAEDLTFMFHVKIRETQ